jgi:hypothetical protein
MHVFWRKVVEAHARGKFSKLLILDDGGDLYTTIPWKQLPGVAVAGVEQTQRGIGRLRGVDMRMPSIVSVASSGIKKIIESEFIGVSVVEKLLSMGHLVNSQKVGVIGMGHIGREIFQRIKNMGLSVICYDLEKPDGISTTEFRTSLDVLVRDSDLIIGSTGSDILRGATLDAVYGTKIFVSASSADIEFNTLLSFAQGTHDPLATIDVVPHAGLTCRILNGGFPINFDREREWEPDADIALTRCLLYVGMMQAAALVQKKSRTAGFYALDTEAQKHILDRWIALKDETKSPIKESYRDSSRVAKAIFVEGVKTTPSVWKE